MARCPDCDTPIQRRNKVRLGQLLQCPECEAELEVINLDPFEVDYFLGDEHWEEEEEEY